MAQSDAEEYHVQSFILCSIQETHGSDAHSTQQQKEQKYQSLKSFLFKEK